MQSQYYFQIVFDVEPSGIFPPLKNRDGQCNETGQYHIHNDTMGDEEVDLLVDLEAALSAEGYTYWPRERYAYVKFGYDKSLNRQLGKERKRFADWVNPVMAHVQSYYRHYSLPTKIQFKVICTINIFFVIRVRLI